MVAGTVFSLGVQRGYMIAPWWLLASISVLGAVPTIFQTEGQGFGGQQVLEVVEAEEAEERGHEILRAEGFVGGAEAAGDLVSPVLSPALRYREDGEVATLPRDLSRLEG